MSCPSAYHNKHISIDNIFANHLFFKSHVINQWDFEYFIIWKGYDLFKASYNTLQNLLEEYRTALHALLKEKTLPRDVKSYLKLLKEKYKAFKHQDLRNSKQTPPNLITHHVNADNVNYGTVVGDMHMVKYVKNHRYTQQAEPVLSMIGNAELDEYRKQTDGRNLELPGTISQFIDDFEKAMYKNDPKSLITWMLKAKLHAWMQDDDDLKKVIEIYEYLVQNLPQLKQIDKNDSELQCFFPTYHILNILFRNTDIKLVIGEKGCDATKAARENNEQCTTTKKPSNIHGRKLDLILQSNNVELCSAEWKSMAATNVTLMKQYVKNLRVNKCILVELSKILGDDDIEILGMDWKGFVGYIYVLKTIDKVTFAKEVCRLFLPQDQCEFQDFRHTIAALLHFKTHYYNIGNIVKFKCAQRRRKRQLDDLFDATPSVSRSPSPHTFFTPKRHNTRQ
ncbi:hypothetical protein EC973_004486 [Apophysomyces ossiformis]|uniref:Uncharacterized protein n=1 Tax=Apophysomyces ossiformis TaxID=679940 RepID=A0A8H7BK68_9FUNG|nr:hypothetical protein EC973_004486 [Apophysomyces ossiformis]